MSFNETFLCKGLSWTLVLSLLSLGPMQGCHPRVIRSAHSAEAAPIVYSDSSLPPDVTNPYSLDDPYAAPPDPAKSENEAERSPPRSEPVEEPSPAREAQAESSSPPGEPSSKEIRHNTLAPTRDEVVQDAMVHAIMGLDAYVAGDLPSTKVELDTALDTMLAADLPQGERGLELLNRYLPAGYRHHNLKSVYSEAAARNATEVPESEEQASEIEGEVGGPQGIGVLSGIEAKAGSSEGAASGTQLAPPPDVTGSAPEGQRTAAQNKPAESKYLSPEDMIFVRREIERIVAAFGEKRYPHSEIFEQQVAYFVKLYQTELHGFFERSLLRSVKYIDMVKEVLREKGVPGVMAYIAFVESGFRTNARSGAGAVGLWQFMPRTARAYGLQVSKRADDRLDPRKSTTAAREYFLDLVAIFGSSSFLLAMASYNAGEGKVQYCLKQVDDPFTQRTFWDIRSCLRTETREYIPRIIAAAIVAQAPGRFGFSEVQQFFDSSKYAMVDVPFPVSLNLVATVAQISVDDLRALNLDLGSRSSITPRDSSDYRLLVPANRKAAIESELALIARKKGMEVSVAQAPPKYASKDDEPKTKVTTAPPRAEPSTSGSRKAESSATRDARGSASTSSAGAGSRSSTITSTSGTGSGNSSASGRSSSGTNVASSHTGNASSAKVVRHSESQTRSRRARKPRARGHTRYIKYSYKKGNTMAQLAKDFDTSEAKLLDWNPYLRTRSPKPGDTIYVYELDWSYEKHVHRVKRGDTLSGLSARYGAGVDEIRRWNGLFGNTLYAGKELVIYTHDGQRVSRSRHHTRRDRKKPSGKPVIFEVQPGHNLSIIAAMFNTDFRDIMKWNGLSSGHIMAGQKLKIYPGPGVVEVKHKVQSGDSLIKLARKYNTDTKSIQALNGMGDSDVIRTGQVLVVYRRTK